MIDAGIAGLTDAAATSLSFGTIAVSPSSAPICARISALCCLNAGFSASRPSLIAGDRIAVSLNATEVVMTERPFSNCKVRKDSGKASGPAAMSSLEPASGVLNAPLESGWIMPLSFKVAIVAASCGSSISCKAASK